MLEFGIWGIEFMLSPDVLLNYSTSPPMEHAWEMILFQIALTKLLCCLGWELVYGFILMIAFYYPEVRGVDFEVFVICLWFFQSLQFLGSHRSWWQLFDLQQPVVSSTKYGLSLELHFSLHDFFPLKNMSRQMHHGVQYFRGYHVEAISACFSCFKTTFQTLKSCWRWPRPKHEANISLIKQVQ